MDDETTLITAGSFMFRVGDKDITLDFEGCSDGQIVTYHNQKVGCETLTFNVSLEAQPMNPLYIEQLKTRLATEATEASPDAVRSIDGIKVMAQKVSVDTPAALRNLADQLKDKIQSGIIVLGSAAGSKAMLIVVVTQDLTGRYHAGNIIKQVAAEVGGRGGGRPDMAQAGGDQPENLDKALAKAYKVVEQL